MEVDEGQAAGQQPPQVITEDVEESKTPANNQMAEGVVDVSISLSRQYSVL